MASLDPSWRYCLKPDELTGQVVLLRHHTADGEVTVERFTGGDPAWREADTDLLQGGVFALDLRTSVD